MFNVSLTFPAFLICGAQHWEIKTLVLPPQTSQSGAKACTNNAMQWHVPLVSRVALVVRYEYQKTQVHALHSSGFRYRASVLWNLEFFRSVCSPRKSLHWFSCIFSRNNAPLPAHEGFFEYLELPCRSKGWPGTCTDVDSELTHHVRFASNVAH